MLELTFALRLVFKYVRTYLSPQDGFQTMLELTYVLCAKTKIRPHICFQTVLELTSVLMILITLF